MKWKIDFEAMREELRRLGLALMIAGLVGGIVENLATSSVVYSALGGFLLVVLGLISKRGKDE